MASVDSLAMQGSYLLDQTLQGAIDQRLAGLSPAEKIAAAQASAMIALALAVDRLADGERY